MVLRNTTALYRPRFFSVKAVASSVKSASKPFSAAIFLMASIPGSIESWRKPVVLLNTSNFILPFLEQEEIVMTERSMTKSRNLFFMYSFKVEFSDF
ncbi:hypothetical protein D9M69_630160 [compost metagenome]